jgi:hypothetical protein
MADVSLSRLSSRRLDVAKPTLLAQLSDCAKLALMAYVLEWTQAIERAQSKGKRIFIPAFVGVYYRSGVIRSARPRGVRRVRPHDEFMIGPDEATP